MRVAANLFRAFVAVLALGLLAACHETPRGLIPVPKALLSKMEKLNMDATAPIFVRIFKEESALEVWKQRRDGQYALLKSYEVCKWSGELGPKFAEGDKQAPEGFYTVTPAQMNPNSNYYLSFNIGYPNAYDKAHGRTGSNLMVHGACSSAGCYSMTDESAGEIFALARDAFRGGQTSFQVHAFPFQMTPANMAKHASNSNYAFWQMLKPGYDSFEATKAIPTVDVCNKQYVVNQPDKACAPAATGIPMARAKEKDNKVLASVVRVETPAVVKAAATPNPTVAKAAATPARTSSGATTSSATTGSVTTAPANTSTATTFSQRPPAFDDTFGSRRSGG